MKHNIASPELKLIQQAYNKMIPLNGTLELLPLCNMNCRMCYIRMSKEEMDKEGSKLLSWKEWLNIARKMKEAGTVFLLLTGGEPLLYPEFKKLYLGLRELGMILTINSNGTLINEEWALFFAQNKPRRINITLYGINESSYEEVCDYAPGYQKTINAIHLLKKNNVPVKINGSLIKSNKQDLKEIYEFAETNDILAHVDTYMIPGKKDKTKKIELQSRLSPEEAAEAEFISWQKEMDHERFIQYCQNLIKTIEETPPNYPETMTCQSCHNSYAIDWQGNMKPCVSLDQPSISVLTNDFHSAWNKMTSLCLNTYKISHICSTCCLRPICKICIASAILETGDPLSVPSYHCRQSNHLYNLLKHILNSQ